jgi:predicted MFS family arabinose efflux permease
LIQERGFERASIAKILGWITLVGGIGGNICGGIISDLFISRFKQPRAMFLFWVGLFSAPFILAMRIADPDSIWLPLGMFIGAFQVGCFWGPVFATVQEIAPASMRATVVAFYIRSINLIGLGLGATITGISVDLLRSANYSEPYSYTLIAMNILTLSNLIFFSS